MGHKAALIDGAKASIIAKGYAHTTARDVVELSKTNLGSIGYHYGSLENLLGLALTELQDSWGDRVASDLADLPVGEQRFQEGWRTILEDTLNDGVNVISGIEVLNQALRSEPVRERVAQAHEEARIKLADVFLPSAADRSLEDKRALGLVVLALIAGLMVQRSVASDVANNMEEFLRGIALLAEVAG
ncbi:MAG: hypothetical protein CL555_21180 [Algoriphagus sp.]|jgi:AcrR family transcriptional regulator|uniref:TetR/AcrR family transcriptional regulator n=1 Tax=Pelagibacterium sp. TaxID=1967288 RepID=UPI000C8E78B1|nr:hypothetical protein [Algoriphagus sp.]|tara:strand:- start:590 stop:1153 length:564 start_codon:yes stop_codon:yes gene_type:complete